MPRRHHRPEKPGKRRTTWRGSPVAEFYTLSSSSAGTGCRPAAATLRATFLNQVGKPLQPRSQVVSISTSGRKLPAKMTTMDHGPSESSPSAAKSQDPSSARACPPWNASTPFFGMAEPTLGLTWHSETTLLKGAFLPHSSQSRLPPITAITTIGNIQRGNAGL